MSSTASYKGSRLSLPRLCNTYAALQESFQYPFDNANLLLVAPNAGMDSIQGFEPVFTPANFLTGSPLATAMFQRYEEFRIRKVRVTFTPSVINPVNAARSDAFIYWIPNHKNFDDEGGIAQYTTVGDISEAARFQRVGVQPGRGIILEYIPQVFSSKL